MTGAYALYTGLRLCVSSHFSWSCLPVPLLPSEPALHRKFVSKVKCQDTQCNLYAHTEHKQPSDATS